VKHLECSVNYDGKGDQSSRLARKGRDGKGCLLSQRLFFGV
jgi:hypothetical protein